MLSLFSSVVLCFIYIFFFIVGPPVKLIRYRGTYGLGVFYYFFAHQQKVRVMARAYAYHFFALKTYSVNVIESPIAAIR